jgi:hypothetical protein
MSFTRILVAALAAAALAAPAAHAVPADYPDGHPQPQAQTKQDLRSPDAREGVRPDTVGGITQTPVGQPTWPANPKPIVTVADEAPDTGGGGIDWPVVGIGMAGGLLAAGGAAAFAFRRRVQRLPA